MKPALIHIENLTVNLLPGARASELVHGELANWKHASGKQFELSEDGLAVIDHVRGLMWAADELPRADYDGAEKAVTACRLGGFTDWRLPELDELESIRDITRHEPCLDTSIFKSNSGWVWTKTPCAWSPGRVWVVDFHGGDVDSYYRYYQAFVRPVRSVLPAGQ